MHGVVQVYWAVSSWGIMSSWGTSWASGRFPGSRRALPCPTAPPQLVPPPLHIAYSSSANQTTALVHIGPEVQVRVAQGNTLNWCRAEGRT